MRSVATASGIEAAAGPREGDDDGTPGPGMKQPYEKPSFRTIDLAAEEVLAVGCKLDGGPGGPIGASCTASSCFAAGS